VVADGVDVEQFDDLPGRLGVPGVGKLRVGPRGQVLVGVEHLVALGDEAVQAGADQGDLVAAGGQPVGEPADLVQPAKRGRRHGLRWRRDKRHAKRWGGIGHG